MYAFQRIICTAALGFVTLGTSAQASISHTAAGLFSPPKAELQLIDADSEIAPIAFYRFCAKNNGQCHSDTGGQKIEMNDETWAMLHLVNSTINDRIEPNSSKGAFDWSLSTSFGNCNDYAVQKRNALLKEGFPMSSLSLAAVKTKSGEGHLILTVRTTSGDFVLDNLRAKIVAWNETGYQWISVQSNADPFHWVHVKSVPLVAIASNSYSNSKGVARFDSDPLVAPKPEYTLVSNMETSALDLELRSQGRWLRT